MLDLKVCDPAMGSGAFLVEACRQLGDTLIETWKIHGGRPAIPPDEDETVFARRLVAQKCLYGVDRNPLAVDLAKLSLWLVTLAKDHPLTFVDHALRAGDSLVGFSERQIGAFHWAEAGGDLFAGTVRDSLSKVRDLRGQIRNANEDVPDAQRRSLWKDAEGELAAVRWYGDLLAAAFFGGTKPAIRNARRKSIAADLARGEAERHRSWIEELRTGDPPLAPFHWEIEFPEVFDRDNPGFDAFVGNPPFLGGKRISTVQGTGYRDWLSQLHQGATRNADLAAHFFRRAFHLIRKRGTLGLIATNTIAQGDTRSGGLRWICEYGGEIYAATRRYNWPGQAAVMVSIVHVVRGHLGGHKWLDEIPVERITAFLFHEGGHHDPVRLSANVNGSFVGMFLRGMGFTFDDTDKRGVASSLSERSSLVLNDARNLEVIVPYIGGEELNASPRHEHHRYTIDFCDYPLCRRCTRHGWQTLTDKERSACLRSGIVPLDYPGHVAEDWPAILAVVDRKVKPFRLSLGQSPLDQTHKRLWWRFGNTRPRLRSLIKGLDRILVTSRHSHQMSFAFISASTVPSDALIAFPFQSHSAFCALQCRLHETWVRFFGSSMKDDLRYTPSDCFETFPFPGGWESSGDLEAAGKKYYEHRAALMVAHSEGLTKTYNRFHDPYEHSPAIVKLRNLHAAMDRAVLDAYSWTDIPTACDFFPLHPDDKEDPNPSARPKRKPHRYRWPDEIQNEVLARLLDLNTERADAEQKRRTTG